MCYITYMKPCVKCGGVEKDTRGRCRICHIRRNRAHVLRKVLSGRCEYCASVAEMGKRTCAECRLKRTLVQSARLQAKKSVGQCVNCLGQAENGRIRCRNCLDEKNSKQARLYDDKRERGECRNCSAKAEIDKSQCVKCANNNTGNHARYMSESECGRIAATLRNRLGSSLKGNSKAGSAVRDLGCTIAELKAHLESKFYRHPKTGEVMTWKSWGIHGWHIDHVKPLASFDLTDRQQFLAACHYTNLQPLWAEANLRKSDKAA